MAPCSAPAPTSTVAVIFGGGKGGLSDVGRFAVMHARSEPGVRLVPIALSLRRAESVHDATQSAVQYAGGNERLAEAFKGLEFEHLDVEDDGTQSRLAALLKGCDAVVAALGNRQPGLPRYLEAGARLVVGALEEAGVRPRLVVLSSFGIGDFRPRTLVEHIWRAMLLTVLRGARSDLQGLERAVASAPGDYLLVRPVGMADDVEPTGEWRLMTGPGEMEINVNKEDVARCLLEEALRPTLHSTAVIVCPKAKGGEGA